MGTPGAIASRWRTSNLNEPGPLGTSRCGGILREFLGKKTRHALFVRLPGKPPQLEMVEIEFVRDGRFFVQALPERLEGAAPPGCHGAKPSNR